MRRGIRSGLGLREELQRESGFLSPAARCPRGLGQAGSIVSRSGVGLWIGFWVPAWLCHLLNFCEPPFSHLHKRVYKSAMYVKHLVLVGKRVVIIILTVVRVVGVLRRE